MKKSCDLDVGLATQVQKILLPKSSPTCTWGDIGFTNRMARGVGGDYFDFLTMSDGCQVIFLGDVTGHGLHAAMIMALLYGYIHRAFSADCPCRDIVNQVNEFLLSFSTRSRDFDQYFSTTLFYAIINPENRRMKFINAGHPAPLVRRAGTFFTLPATSPPLGFFEAPEISMESIQLKKGDRILLYTDGITEATNQDGVPFGQERLEHVLLTTGGGHLEVLDKLFDAHTAFTKKDSLDDDCTAIVVDFQG